MNTDAKVWAPVATFVAVLGVGAAAVLTGGGGDGGGPRPLRLADAGVAAADSAKLGAPVAGGTAGGYTLTGSLPEGRPDDAPTWTLPGGAGPAAPVARLATALGEGTPTRQGEGWRAGGLTVSGDPGRSWWWSSCGSPDDAVASDGAVGCAVAAPGAVSSGGGSAGSATTPVAGKALAGPAVTVLPPTCTIAATQPDGTPLTDQELREAESHCPVSSGGTTTVPPPLHSNPPLPPLPAPPTPTEDAVRRAVAPVLDALGLTGADVQVYAGGGTATVRPSVGGVEVSGLATTISVDADAKVVGGSGWLASPERADTYPLVTAQEAFDALPPTARPLVCAVTPDGGCKEPGPVEITGAHLGLTVAPLREGGQVLVPAWLFDVKGSTEPVAAVAVQPQFLLKDDPTPSEPAVEPGTPESVPPAPNGTAPARGPLSFDSAFRGDTPNSVVVQYGESGSCPNRNVTSVAKEDATTVYVVLEADLMPPDQVCTADYRPVRVTVDLQAPLGERKVVDTSTGKQVPLS